MFGFSLPKIILLLVIIFLVWQVFKIIEKRNKLKNNLLIMMIKKNDNYESLIECKKMWKFFKQR